MTVKDLINKLSECDPDLKVLIRGYESGFNYANYIEKAFIIKNPMKKSTNWWDGEYETAEEGTPAIIIKN